MFKPAGWRDKWNDHIRTGPQQVVWWTHNSNDADEEPSWQPVQIDSIFTPQGERDRAFAKVNARHLLRGDTLEAWISGFLPPPPPPPLQPHRMTHDAIKAALADRGLYTGGPRRKCAARLAAAVDRELFESAQPGQGHHPLAIYADGPKQVPEALRRNDVWFLSTFKFQPRFGCLSSSAVLWMMPPNASIDEFVAHHSAHEELVIAGFLLLSSCQWRRIKDVRLASAYTSLSELEPAALRPPVRFFPSTEIVLPMPRSCGDLNEPSDNIRARAVTSVPDGVGKTVLWMGANHKAGWAAGVKYGNPPQYGCIRNIASVDENLQPLCVTVEKLILVEQLPEISAYASGQAEQLLCITNPFDRPWLRGKRELVWTREVEEVIITCDWKPIWVVHPSYATFLWQTLGSPSVFTYEVLIELGGQLKPYSRPALSHSTFNFPGGDVPIGCYR